jgi:hypothetical protein
MTSVGVIPFRDVGTGETSVVLRADTDVRFWADFDGLYEPSYFAQYDVELIQGDRVVSTVQDLLLDANRGGLFGEPDHPAIACAATFSGRSESSLDNAWAPGGPPAPR